MRCCCTAIEERFTVQTANHDLARYRDRGPRKTTRMLLDALRAEGVAGRSLLDIGGGVGVIAHELVPAGATHVTSVEASSAYLAAAREEAERQGYADRLTAHHGDFVALADAIPVADIVTLDRVICCYPDMAQLVAASAAHARLLYAITVPRDTWWVRLGIGLESLPYWLHRTSFRIYAHPLRAIEAGIRRAGLQRRARRTTFAWDIRIYRAAAQGLTDTTEGLRR
jgi:magnesium-protoporphyrin O-methyltransferase